MQALPWLIASLLLAAAGPEPFAPALGGDPARAEPPLAVEVAAAAWGYGPEADWQAGLDQRGRLGAHLDVQLNVSRDGGADPAWTYVAELTDGTQTVMAEGQAADGTLALRFDVDGHAGNLLTGPHPPLASGEWAVRVQAYSGSELTGLQPEGWGQAALEARPVSFAQVLWSGSEEGWEEVPRLDVPAGTLPGIAETGGAPTTFIKPMLSASESLLVGLNVGEQGVTVEWRVHSVSPGDLASGFTVTELGATTSLHEGIAWLFIDGIDEENLHVVSATAVDAPGGTAAFAFGSGDADVQIASVDAVPGGTGPMAVAVPAASGGLVHAVATADARLTTSPILVGPDGPTAWFDPTPIRAERLDSYHLLAFSTLLGLGYGGHDVIERGLHVDIDAPAMGAGTPADIRTQMTNAHDAARHTPPGLAIEAATTLRFGGSDVANRHLVVPPGGTVESSWSVTPAEEGSTPIEVLIDAGDLLFEERKTVAVASADDYAIDQRPWYDPGKYVPGPGPAALLVLLAVAAAVRRARVK